MTYTDHSEPLNDLAGVLQKHFNALSKEEAKRRADELLSVKSLSGALQKLDGSNVPPQRDLENIRKAAKAMASVYKHLSEVGWHGQETFSAVLEPFLEKSDYSFFVNSGARSLAKDALLERVQNLRDGLDDAVKRVNLDGPSVMTAFGQGAEFDEFRKTKIPKTQARFFTRKCAEFYFELTGEDPEVWTRRELNEAYGPFYDLIKDIFGACKIKASPEGFAREVCKEFSQKKT